MHHNLSSWNTKKQYPLLWNYKKLPLEKVKTCHNTYKKESLNDHKYGFGVLYRLKTSTSYKTLSYIDMYKNIDISLIQAEQDKKTTTAELVALQITIQARRQLSKLHGSNLLPFPPS
jgi:hypothetical protein